MKWTVTRIFSFLILWCIKVEVRLVLIQVQSIRRIPQQTTFQLLHTLIAGEFKGQDFRNGRMVYLWRIRISNNSGVSTLGFKTMCNHTLLSGNPFRLFSRRPTLVCNIRWNLDSYLPSSTIGTNLKLGPPMHPKCFITSLIYIDIFTCM